jgi:tetratricopeptide (TPR) repeat protein
MNFLINTVMSNPYVPWIAGLLVFLYAYQKLAPRLHIRVPGSALTMDDVMGMILGARYAEAKAEKAVGRFKKQGNFLAAGRTYEEAGKLPAAVEAYTEGGEYWAAASLLERMGKGERAAELYLQAGDHKKAAQVFSQIGKPGKAAALFQEKGNNLEAARLYGLAGMWDKAADLYLKSGYPLRAAEAYEKRGDFRKAAECHERHFMENVSYSTTYSSTAPSKDQKSALLAGRLYEKAGDLNHALAVYHKGGYFKEAANVCLGLKQYEKAAELFMRAEDPQSAAGAYEQAGDRVRAATLLGEIAFKVDRIPEAAAYFQQGQDYLRAAELYESVGMLKEAAGAFEAGDSYGAAGGVYIRAGLTERAAVSYERAGEFETAAKLYEECGSARAIELYERAGFTFKSGEAAARAGRRDAAIALLQRVAPADDNYRAATELLARLFVESGRPGLAVERLQRVIAGQPVVGATLDLYYWLAYAFEASGQSGTALELYKKVQAENLQYRDVETRVSQLQAWVPQAPPAASSSTPSPEPTAIVVDADELEGPVVVADCATPEASASAPNESAPTRSASRGPAVQTAAEAEHAGIGPTAASNPGASSSGSSAGAAIPPASAKPNAAVAGTPPKVPRFSRQEHLGAGPLGEVWRGEDRDGRSVALRLLPAARLTPHGVIQALVADLKAASQLSHPNVVKVLGLIELDGHRCVVTEFVKGRTLANALSSGMRMSFQQVHGLGRVVAHALSALHSRGLVHGSVQPSNVMVASGVIKLADLGLGRLAHAVPRAESYRAPEAQLDPGGDLYSLAALLYHVLTGNHPASQPQGAALPLPSTLASGVPESFDKLLLRCLHPRVELRLASADEILRELKDMMRIG